MDSSNWRFKESFATLKPSTIVSIKAASRVFKDTVEDQDRYAHHVQNIYCDGPQALLRTLMTPGASSPGGSATDTSSEGTVPDPENDSSLDLVWPARYVFSFSAVPKAARFGWVVGYGHGWENPKDSGKVDILLASSVLSRASSLLKSKHAFFNFVLPSGHFAVRRAKSAAFVSVDGEPITDDGFRLLLRHEHSITLGDLEFRFEYTVPPRRESDFLHSKNEFLLNTLQMALPNPFASVTPRTGDEHFSHWTLFKTAGAGAESVVRSAVSTSGDLAAVIRKEYYRPNDKANANKIIDALAEVRTRLHRRNSLGKEFVLELIDSFVSNTETIYIITSPLGLTDFTGELFRENHRHHDRLFAQIIAGISAIHDAGFLHNDIKPRNLVVATFDPPRAAIIDIASAVDMSPYRVNGVPALPGRSGTIGYLAPEREASNSRYGFPSDIWSLGTVGLQILVEKNRHAPFPRRVTTNPFRDFDISELRQPLAEAQNVQNTDKQLRDYVRRNLSALSVSAGAQSAGLESLLAKMLALDPADRISAHEACRHQWTASLIAQRTSNPQPGEKRTR